MALTELTMATEVQAREAAAKLRSAAVMIDGDSTPSQVGMSIEEHYEMAALLDRIADTLRLSADARKQVRAERKRANQAERDLAAMRRYPAA